ncbi:histidine phosphatase family protein [Caviibacterium pharyngocola]|uniref:Histidine phosphatase family protein n=1 Tax=Caviibacterium pharyngocola TaxID=28159 RepID=A0A2M8RW48_9PAST|nr:histidine phosphatase family protein [Caviibacterium pharyngocola]PJG83116.1 histidine phosphatase family protein [Caviibacterium pharyngocola]
MKHIYLIRHAESFANAGGQALADSAIPLSEKGQRQAQELVARLPPSAKVYTSEFLRTQQTAQPYCAHWQVNTEVLPCLNEFSYLPLAMIEGLTGQQRQPLVQSFWSQANPDLRLAEETDSFAQFNRRIDQFLAAAPDFAADTLCFGHGIWIALLVWRLLGFSAESGEDMQKFRQFQPNLPMKNTAIWQLKLINDKIDGIYCLNP